jgi:hypothetical protein
MVGARQAPPFAGLSHGDSVAHMVAVIQPASGRAGAEAGAAPEYLTLR